MRTILWYFYFAFGLILSFPSLLKANKMKKSSPLDEYNAFVEKSTRMWALSLAKISGTTFYISGTENIPKGAVLYVSNHQGNFDINIFISFIEKPKGYIAKIEITKIPILRSWMKHMNCVFMDRTDLKKSAKAILEGIEILKGGHSLVVFPEGTRSKSDNIGEFKAGSFKLATKSKVPIVPVSINGSYKIMEANNNRIKPAEVFVKIHQPIYTENLTKEEIAELPNKVKDIISSGIAKK